MFVREAESFFIGAGFIIQKDVDVAYADVKKYIVWKGKLRQLLKETSKKT